MDLYGRLCLILAAGICLAACTPKASDTVAGYSVIGPDLGKDGPFQAAHEISLVEVSPVEAGSSASVTSSSEPAPDTRMRMDIVRNPNENVATLTHVISDTQTYLAGVTYQRFVPIVAETNAEAKDYWIVGLNLTRTPDRSIYTVLRYPHGLTIAPGMVSEAFEYLSLSCSDLDLARQDHFAIETTDKAGKTQTRTVPLEVAPPAENGDCEYNSRGEALRITPAIFKTYDKLKNEADAPHLSWRPLHVEVR